MKFKEGGSKWKSTKYDKVSREEVRGYERLTLR